MPDAELAARRGTAQIAAAGGAASAGDAHAARSRSPPRWSENFAGQWLQFKNIDVVRPDLAKFPMFDDGLRQAMRRETEMFIDNIIRNDRQRPGIAGRELHVRERAAGAVLRHSGRYRAGVPARGCRAATERGGGILAHASVLTVSSYSTRTSPVLRGKWILENLLNAPPPPPPPGVPPLDESKGGRNRNVAAADGGASEESGLRVVPFAHGPAGLRPGEFQRHRRLAHAGWQVSGGRIRRAARRPRLSDARPTEGAPAIRIAARSLRGLAEKLLTYALGRGLERYDKPALAGIAAKLPSQDYKFLATGFGNREQPAVPDAERSPRPARLSAADRRAIEMNFLTQQAHRPPHAAERRGRRDRASGARRHVSGAWPAPPKPAAPRWRWCTFPTASS